MVMNDHRTGRDKRFDDSVDRNQKWWWHRAQSIAGPRATITQVGQTGFHFRAPGKIISEFEPWPRSDEATDGSKFGRVTPRKGQA